MKRANIPKRVCVIVLHDLNPTPMWRLQTESPRKVYLNGAGNACSEICSKERRKTHGIVCIGFPYSAGKDRAMEALLPGDGWASPERVLSLQQTPGHNQGLRRSPTDSTRGCDPRLLGGARYPTCLSRISNLHDP